MKAIKEIAQAHTFHLQRAEFYAVKFSALPGHAVGRKQLARIRVAKHLEQAARIAAQVTGGPVQVPLFP